MELHKRTKLAAETSTRTRQTYDEWRLVIDTLAEEFDEAGVRERVNALADVSGVHNPLGLARIMTTRPEELGQVQG